MKIDSIKFGLAVAIVSAVSWVICGLLVFSMPSGMMRMSGHMMHSDMSRMSWVLTGGGFVIGLVAWSVIAGLFAWAIAAVYNRLLG